MFYALDTIKVTLGDTDLTDLQTELTSQGLTVQGISRVDIQNRTGSDIYVGVLRGGTAPSSTDNIHLLSDGNMLAFFVYDPSIFWFGGATGDVIITPYRGGYSA